MELLQLRYFLESANTGSFTETAKKFMVPQSSVSITIKRLEKELGCQLFDRHKNRIMLNDNGRKLQYSLTRILGELDHVTAELSKNVAENVELHILAKAFRSSVIAAIIEYRKQHPGVRFKTSFDEADTQYEKYDLLVTTEPISAAGFESLPLSKKKLRMTIASNSTLCGRPITMEDLRDQSFLITSRSSNSYKVLQRACRDAGFEPNIAMEVNDIQYYNLCVKAGIGIGLTRGVVPPRPGIELLDVIDFNQWTTYYISYKKPVKCLQLQQFIDYLRSLNF